MSKILFTLLISLVGLQAHAADTTPVVQGSIYRLYKDGSQKLLRSHAFYMEESGVIFLQTSSNQVYCKVGTLLSSSSQPYKGIQCSLYGNESNHLGWAYNAFFPWILDHPSENKFEDSKGRKYLIRFEAITQNETALKDTSGLLAVCKSKTTGAGSRVYQELNCAIEDQNRNNLAQNNLLYGESLTVNVEQPDYYYTVQCAKKTKDI